MYTKADIYIVVINILRNRVIFDDELIDLR